MDINNPVNINTGMSSTVEMMTPFSSTNDDAPRLQMNSAQQKHIIPTKGSTKPMYGTGVEKSVHLSMPDGFIVKAKDDGKVEKVDEDHGLVVLKYDNGQKDVIDISKRLYNNSAGGFYQNLDLTLMYKPGRKFKKGDIVAKNNDFFKGTDPKDLNYSVGTLSKIALSSSDGTYEDSTVITDKMSDMLESEFVNKREVLLDKSTKVLALVAEDENVKASDPLIVFEDGLDDADANDAMNAFAEFDDDDLEDLLSDSISRKKLAKHAGNIVKVNLYYNTPIDEMSPSLAKIVRKYENKNDAKIKVIQSELGDSPKHEYQNNVISGMESDPNRLNGQEASGVLIEWYIKSAEPMAVGDKINL